MRPAVLLLVFAILDGIDHSLRNSVTTAASRSAKNGGEIVVGLFLFFVIFALIITTIAAVAFLGSAQYAVTDRRVVAKYGLIKRSSVDLLLTKISGVKVNQGLLGRVFDFGNVLVQSSGASRRIVLVKSPKAFQSAILTQLEESRLLKGTAAYQLDVKLTHQGSARQTNIPPKSTSAPPLPPGTPAQWERDPFDQNVMRYWDGDRWTDHTAPAP
jgi:uncharacterized membrane protein YdbT with pleckstrin-like domain